MWEDVIAYVFSVHLYLFKERYVIPLWRVITFVTSSVFRSVGKSPNE